MGDDEIDEDTEFMRAAAIEDDEDEDDDDEDDDDEEDDDSEPDWP